MKKALVREPPRRGVSLNDVAVGLLAEEFDVAYHPTGRRSPLPGSSLVLLLRMPSDLKHEIEAQARRTGSSSNDVIVRALAEALAVSLPSSRKDPMASPNGSSNGRNRSGDKVRVALIGVGNCATRSSRASSSTRTPTRMSSFPG